MVHGSSYVRSPALGLAVSVFTLGCGAGESERDPAPFDAAPYCVPAAELAVDLGILPKPTRILLAGEALQLDSLSWSATSEEGAVLSELALPTSGEATLRVTAHPAAEWASLTSTCGLGVDPKADSYYLLVRKNGPHPTADVFAPDARGRFYAVQSLAQLLGRNALRELAVYDEPQASLRGVMEGFYGEAWTQESRLEVLRAMARLKLNTYVFAPKYDASIDLFWRNPFTPDDFERMRGVVDEARRQHIRVCWEMYPGRTIVFSRQDDFDALMGKYRAIADEGIDCFLLAFDDVDKKLRFEDEQAYASYVEAQVDLANRLSEALHAEYPSALLGYVPNDYYTKSADAEVDLPYLRDHLSELWTIGWTGPEVISPSIRESDVAAIDALLGRAPMLGDNYPVSDNPHSSGVLILGPLVGRWAGLPAKTRGMLFNAMPFAYASLPGLATSADFAWNPAAYEPKRSLRDASVLLVGESGAQAFEALCRVNQSPILAASAAPELDGLVADYWSAFDGPGEVSSVDGELRSTFELFEAAEAAAGQGFAGPGFVSEVAPWLDKLSGYGAAGQRALDLLQAKRSGEEPDAQAVASLEEQAAALQASNEKPTGASMDGFLAQAIARLTEP